MAMTYDRRVGDELIAALKLGGFASSLVDCARAGRYPVDLQLRGYEGKSDHWATLYVGLTKVIDLHYRPKDKFRLATHATYAKGPHGWDESWMKSQSSRRMAAAWPKVDDYLDAVLPTIGASHLKEGAVQAAVSSLRTRDLVVIDREVVVSFADKAEKAARSAHVAGPLLAAVEAPNGAAWWEGRPSSLGGECDALALSAAGGLLAIEVKPSSAQVKGIAWSPLQARNYANLITAWAKESSTAAVIIHGMLAQRVELGLVDRFDRYVRDPISVRPMLVLDHGCSATALKRMWEVEHRLRAELPNDPPVSVYELRPSGRLVELNPPEENA